MTGFATFPCNHIHSWAVSVILTRRVHAVSLLIGRAEKYYYYDVLEMLADPHTMNTIRLNTVYVKRSTVELLRAYSLTVGAWNIRAGCGRQSKHAQASSATRGLRYLTAHTDTRTRSISASRAGCCCCCFSSSTGATSSSKISACPNVHR